METESNSTPRTSTLSATATPVPDADVQFVLPSPNPIQSTQRRKRSMVWNYFSKLPGDKPSEARCDECGMKIATASNTTNMIKVLLIMTFPFTLIISVLVYTIIALGKTS